MQPDRLWGSGKGKKAKRKADAASEYAASRYVCALKEVMEQAVKGELDAEAYPSVLPMPTRCAVVGVDFPPYAIVSSVWM